MRNGDREMFPVNLLVKRRRVVVRALNAHGRIIFTVRKLAADADLLPAGGASFIGSPRGGNRQPQAGGEQQMQYGAGGASGKRQTGRSGE